MISALSSAFDGGAKDVPTGGGDPKHKTQKKKSKKQLEKELKKGPGSSPPPMTFEVVKPKRKTQDW
jgi:hypothetical protein